ncbi:MAG: aminotransferase class V-fold PLP-dependent enzyme, partial [Alphaproteobacteria bacterium]
MAKPIYLDYQATTPLDARVLAAMQPYLTEHFGNPHSSTHRYGWEAKAAVDVSREQVASLIHAPASDLIFTSGATESNNLALKGVMRAARGSRDHLVTVTTEHKCVLETAAALEREGTRVTYVPVRPDGLVDCDRLADAITDDTALVSVMAVNNEIGVIQPLADIAALCRHRGALLHSDGAQAFGKMPLDMAALSVDLLSISGHKIYGPKGVGALYVRDRAGKRLVPHMDGGGQEAGIRSGTLSPALCVGLGTAAAIAAAEMEAEQARAARHWSLLLDRLRAHMPNLIVNGSQAARLKSNLNVSFPGVDGAKLLSRLRGVAVSSGAACASAVSGPSYVLAALGVPDAVAQATLRIGTGRFTSDEDV